MYPGHFPNQSHFTKLRTSGSGSLPAAMKFKLPAAEGGFNLQRPCLLQCHGVGGVKGVCVWGAWTGGGTRTCPHDTTGEVRRDG